MAIKGIIGYLHLENFWNSLNSQEKSAIVRYYQSALGADPNRSPIEGNIISSSQTALNYLCCGIGWALHDKNYVFVDKIIAFGERLYAESDLVDRHFFLQECMKAYYRQREFRSDALRLSAQYAIRDIQLFPAYGPILAEFCGAMPHIATFHQLAIIYEKAEMFEDVMKVCKLALKYGLHDRTKGGYPARIERIKKKIIKINKDKR